MDYFGGEPTLADAQGKWKQDKGDVLWGNEACLKILGRHYNVAWLLMVPSRSGEGFFFYCRDDGVVHGQETRYAMLYTTDVHYNAITTPEVATTKRRRAVRGAFLKSELPQNVKDTWGGVSTQNIEDNHRPARTLNDIW